MVQVKPALEVDRKKKDKTGSNPNFLNIIEDVT
jgi:hypothetical protein